MVDLDYYDDPAPRESGKGYGRPKIDLIGKWPRITLAIACAFVIWVVFFGAQFPADGTSAVPPFHFPWAASDQRDSIVTLEAKRAGVNTRLAIAVSHVENWSGDSMAVSSRGAVGLMQVLPKYWQHEFEEECGCGSLFERQRNACKGVRVLAFYLDKYGDTDKALRAYHGSLALHAAGDLYVALVLDQLANQK